MKFEIKKIVKSGKGHVVFLTKELQEIEAEGRVIVEVDKKLKCIRIRSFSILIIYLQNS